MSDEEQMTQQIITGVLRFPGPVPTGAHHIRAQVLDTSQLDGETKVLGETVIPWPGAEPDMTVEVTVDPEALAEAGDRILQVHVAMSEGWAWHEATTSPPSPTR